MGNVVLVISSVVATIAVPTAFVRPPLARLLHRVSVAGLWIALAMVVAALIRIDTSLLIVADNTRPGLNVARRIMGLWGSSAGSLLLFVAIVGTVLAIEPTSRSAAALGPLVVAFLAWGTALLSSPFERLDNPVIAGSGLSPILEHWAMLIHPPLLYLGLGLALVPAVTYPRTTRGGTRAALVVLTAALALGSGWAYVELGWGGWWAWDPVENAALIPWLLLVVHLHVPSGHRLARWAGVLVWAAVFGGTAMTRTSLRTSVHAFADADSLKWVLWPLAAIVTAVLLVAVLRDGHTRLRSTPGRLLAAGLVSFSAAVVALGTFRPFIPGEATGGWFYTRALYPVVIVGVVAMGVAPRIPSTPSARLTFEALVGAAIGTTLVLFAGWSIWFQILLAAALGAGVATTLGTGSRSVPRVLAHVGLMLVLVGALGGTASTTRTSQLAVGETLDIGGHSIVNLGSSLIADSPPTLAARIRLDDRHDMHPQLTIYPERGLRLPEVATHSRPLEDVQVILRSADDDGSALITANVQPLTQLVWVGAVALALGIAASYRPRWSRRAFRSSLTVAAEAGVGSAGSGSGSGISTSGGTYDGTSR